MDISEIIIGILILVLGVFITPWLSKWRDRIIEFIIKVNKSRRAYYYECICERKVNGNIGFSTYIIMLAAINVILYFNYDMHSIAKDYEKLILLAENASQSNDNPIINNESDISVDYLKLRLEQVKIFNIAFMIFSAFIILIFIYRYSFNESVNSKINRIESNLRYALPVFTEDEYRDFLLRSYIINSKRSYNDFIQEIFLKLKQYYKPLIEKQNFKYLKL